MTSTRGAESLRTDIIPYAREQIASLVTASAAATHLPLVAVHDWATRAAQALIAGDLDAAVSLAVVHLPKRAVANAGIASTAGSGLLERLKIDHAVHLRSLPSHPTSPIVRSIEWIDSDEHPFLRAGLARGMVAFASAPIGPDYLLSAFKWHGVGEAGPIHLHALETIVGFIANLATAIVPGDELPIDWLSARETEVLDLVLMGQTVPQIGVALSRSPNTIHDHLKAIHRKAQVKTRGELVALAMGRRVPRTAAE